MLGTRWILMCIQERFIREGLRQMNQLHRASVSSFIIHLEILTWLLMIACECWPMRRISLCPHLTLLRHLLPAWYQRVVLGRPISGQIHRISHFIIILAVRIFLASLLFMQILPEHWEHRREFRINSYDSENKRKCCHQRSLIETTQFSQKLAILVFLQVLRVCWFGLFFTVFFLYVDWLKCSWYLALVTW